MQTFEQWWNEIEGYGLRAERFTTPGEAAKAAWDQAMSLRAQADARPVAWLSLCTKGPKVGQVEVAEPNEKSSNPEYWTDAFQVYTHPEASAPGLSEREIADTVNKVRDIAREFHATQQLRERIARVLVPILTRASAAQSPGLSEDAWLALAERHIKADWNSDEPDGYLNAVKALAQDAMSLTRASATTGSPSARIEELRKGLFEARDAMRVMSNWVKQSDPAGHSWGVHMVDRANAVLSGASAATVGEPGADERAAFEASGLYDGLMVDARSGFNWGYRAAQSGHRAGVAEPGDVLRWAAGVVQLYDDATMAADYMIDANDVEGILKALGEYMDRTAAQSGQQQAEHVGQACGDSAEHVGIQQAEPGADEPPLGGRWHHGNGVVVCGTLRIFGEDFDTDPAQDFKESILTWVCDTLNAEQDAYLAAQSGQRAGVAEEWVLVPKEPTKAMLDAAERLDWSNEDVRGNCCNQWNAMLAAAPTQQQQEGGS